MWKEGRMMEDGRMIAKKSISCMRVLCIYRTLLAAQKRIRTAILSTDHSLFTLFATAEKDQPASWRDLTSYIFKLFHTS